MGDLITADTPKRKHSPIKLEDIYDQNVGIQKDLRWLVESQRETNRTVEVIKNDVDIIKHKQSVNDMRLNIIEQNNLSKLMEIKGIERSALEKVNNLKGYVIDLFASYDIKCSDESIESVYVKDVRTKNASYSVIIVNFTNEPAKKSVMLKKISKKDEKNLFFNHVLTAYNRALLYKAKKVGKETNLSFVSFRDGKVHMKKDRGSRSVIIRCFEDIDELASRNTANNSTLVLTSGKINQSSN